MTRTKKATVPAMKTNYSKLMEISHLKMILTIQIATLMQMNFPKEEQFQKIRLNNYSQFPKANKVRNKTLRDKGSIVDP